MSFFAVPPEIWERAALTLVGSEWSRDTAMVDLRFWQDRCLGPKDPPWPSLSQLAGRWGWTIKRVRLLVQRDAEWGDPEKAERWTEWKTAHGVGPKGHDEGTTRARRGHDEGTTGHERKQTIDEQGHDEGTTRERRGHDEGNRRVDPPHHLPPHHDEEKKNAGATPTGHTTDPMPPESNSTISPCHDHADQLRAIEKHLQARTPDATLSGADQKELRLVLRASQQPDTIVANICLVADWFALAPAGLPVTARESDWADTPASWAKLGSFPTRLRKAKAWDAAGRPTEPVSRPSERSPRPELTVAEQLAIAREKRHRAAAAAELEATATGPPGLVLVDPAYADANEPFYQDFDYGLP